MGNFFSFCRVQVSKIGSFWVPVLNASQPPAEKLTKRPDGLLQLNDSVWEFCCPPTMYDVDVVFFHGLQLSDYKEAFWKTWLSRDETVLWPKTWLGESERNLKARILSVSYDSSARKARNNMDLYNIATNFITDLILNKEGVGQDRPVVLVGHSLGGIVIKQFVLTCNQMTHELNDSDTNKIKTFLRNCKGVFFYSTPHLGSRLADYVNRIPVNPFTKVNKRIVSLLQTLNKKTGLINNRFTNTRQRIGIITGAVGESLDTRYKGLSATVVDESSASYDTDGLFNLIPETDHFTVCRPQNMNSCKSYTSLRDFITEKVLDQVTEHNQVLPPTENLLES